MLRVYADLEELFQFEDEWDRALIKLSDAARKAVAAAVDEAPREGVNTRRHYQDQTGLLTSRIKGYVQISVPGGAIGEVGAYTDYASYVDGGTAPHEIRGNPYLTFKGRNGRWVTVQSVQHPGTKPDGFGGRMYQKAEAVMIREIEIGIDNLQRFLES